jgi:hypothetical protein
VTIRPRRGGYQVIVYAGIDPPHRRQRQIARQVKGKREVERLEARLRAVEAGELSVSGNLVHGSGLERGYVRKGPRSEHGMRLVALDPHTVQALGARQERRRSRLGQWNDTLAEDASPLLSGRGRPAPCAPRHDGQAVLQAGAARLGHSYTLHGLRHGDPAWSSGLRLDRA